MRNPIVGCVLAATALGCATSYDPGRLPDLYLERARIQETIQFIEARHGIASRDPEIQRQRDEKHQAELAVLKAREESDRQKAQLELEILTNLAKDEQAFLASLTPEQRLQWMMHCDRMEQERLRAEAAKEQSKAMAQMLKEANSRQARQELIDNLTRSGQRFSNSVRTSGEIMLESQRPTINVNIQEQK